MTREEALNDEPRDYSEFDRINFERLINEIYNDFESRTCGNCKHYMSKANMCTLNIECERRGIDKDFGCNKFEREE